jgi:hypothetical protein
MKLLYKNLKLHQLILFATANLLLVSCGTYQSVYNDDGIYGDENAISEEKKVIVVDEKQYNDYEENYFTKKLEALESIDANEFFTDVDSYNSDNAYIDDEVIDDALNYNANQPWGYEDNDVVVHINLNSNPFMFWSYRNWGFNNSLGFNSGRAWGNPYWGNRFWGNQFWGYNPYWYPFQNGLAWNNGFNNPYWNNRFWNNNNSNRNYRYGRRTTNNSNRYSSVNSRNRTTANRRNNVDSSRRSSSTVRRNNNSTRPTRRNSSTVTRNSSNTRPTRRSSNATRENSRTKRNTTPRRSSSSTRRSSSNSNSRNNNSSTRRSSSSSNNSRSSRSSRSSSSSKKRGN